MVIEWNFNALLEDETDAKLTMEQADVRAQNFTKMYKGNLKNIHSSEFLEAIREYEDILKQMGKVLTYAFLQFAKNSKKGALYAKYEELYTKIEENLLFFPLEFNRLHSHIQNKFIDAANGYGYYLSSLKELKPHQLTQKEERIMLKNSILGASAFSRLFDEHFSRKSFRFDGKNISEEEILSKLYDKERKVRKEAARVLTKGLRPSQHLLGYIFNMVKKDLATKCEIRRYKTPESPRHKENKISQKSVNALIKTVEKNFHLVNKYYDLKKEALEYEVLYDYDRYAPYGGDDEKFEYEKAKTIVLESFGKFSLKFENIAKKAFTEGWIDVYPKKNKRGGAFSHPATPDAHPYILLNYTDKRRDLFTLAHELGHTIHQYLSYDVGYLNGDTPLTTAETASIFAEMLVFDKVKEGLSKDEKIALLGGKIEDIFATLFRQINFTTFERKVHAHEGELSLKDFNEYWLEENKKMFGDSVVLTKDYELWWSYIPHFIHSPFYCYAYSYGQLLVLALYGLYKSGMCQNFKELYGKFLSSGGGQSPADLVKLFGFDIEDENFWKIGLEEVEKMVEEFEGLVHA